MCVLVSRPAELERGLAHAGLGDLFDKVLERVLPELSPPRRRALEVALLLEDATRGSDPRTLGVAVRSALEALAAEAPVVLAVDDVQWLDPSSASALTFALRRMGEQPVHVLLARRTGERAEPSELESAFETDRIERLPVGPLSLGAVHTLLQARLGRTFSRPTLVRVHETSGGNPFYALELARDLGAGVDPTQPLPVPKTLEGLVRARLDELPAPTREALLLAVSRRSSVRRALRKPGRRRARPRSRSCRARDRAHERDDPLHAPAARVGRLPRRVGGRTAARPRTRRPRSSRIWSTAPATSRFRRRRRTAMSPLLSRTPRLWRAPVARPSPPPSSPSTRFA